MNKILGLIILIISCVVLWVADFNDTQSNNTIVQDKIIYYLPKRDEDLERWLA